MGKNIVDIKNMTDALRNTGYKDIESAVSEIVDNSVEANANNIFIILCEGRVKSGRKAVTEIGFLDDGEGMDVDTLGSCLRIGSSTRTKRKGMGRFGVGLPQASLYACPNVEVYSWQNGIDNAQKVFLDINKVKQGMQTVIEDPIKENLPKPYDSYIRFRTENESYDFSQSGTLVIWKNCDNLNPKTRNSLTNKLEFSLGQKFRYFIHDGDIKIKIICNENREAAEDVCPNDPMFLMEDNRVLGDPGEPDKPFRLGEREALEPPFELYTAKGDGTGEVVIPVDYINKDGDVATGSVLARFSIVKNKFYDETAIKAGLNPGNYPLGKAAARMEGVSIIRAKREIDFRNFDFYSAINEPTHRWWGCEIIFEPELDEAFHVANNKQYVELRKIEIDNADPDELGVQPLWNQLSEVITPTIEKMYKQNKASRGGTRKKADNTSPSAEIIDNVEDDPSLDYGDDFPSDENEPTEEEKAKKGREKLIDFGVENPSDKDGIDFFNRKVYFKYVDWGERENPFDYETVFDTVIISINTSHNFYKVFLNKIYNDPEVKVTFELFLGSLFMSVYKSNTYQGNENDRLLITWYNRLSNYIYEQLNPKKRVE